MEKRNNLNLTDKIKFTGEIDENEKNKGKNDPSSLSLKNKQYEVEQEYNKAKGEHRWKHGETYDPEFDPNKNPRGLGGT